MSVNQYETLSEAITALKRRGYGVYFEAFDGLISTPDHRKSFSADEVAVREHHRFEGTSDPDEMAVVYAIETADGTRGILIDAFGVYADPKLGRLITTAQMREYTPSL
ncbi:MAG: phosphoribosylpyrophosphate synthetase [Acidiferrobacterales bacterium]